MPVDATLPSILRSWSWQPLILVGLGLAAGGYVYALHYFRGHGWLDRLSRRGLLAPRHPWFYASGLAALALALLSPVDALSDLLFTAHMVQHILLMMVAAPLILLGLPSPLVRWLILETGTRRALERITHPLLTFGIFNLNLLIWHLPDLYQAALADQLIHDLEHALFFYAALLYWWRVIDPTEGWYPLWEWPPARWLYLLVAAPPSYILGSILWTSSTVWYPYYAQIPRLWGFPALSDQQYGGLIMWIQGWMFMMLSIFAFFAWYDPKTEQV